MSSEEKAITRVGSFCPCCSAPINADDKGQCDYCGLKIISNDFLWKIHDTRELL